MQKHRLEGHVYYITCVVQNRRRIFTRAAYVVPLYDSLIFYTAKLGIALVGYVFMPDHIHLLLWPEQATQMTAFMRDFKEFTAKRVARQAEAESRTDDIAAFRFAGESTGRAVYKVWQDAYWEMNIFTERFLRQKLNYLHRNPVRAELVEDAKDYPYSSFRNYEFGDDSLIEVFRDWA